MTGLCAELLKYIPKNTLKAITVGPIIGFFSLILVGDTNDLILQNMLAHKIAGLLCLLYVCISIIIFTFNQAQEVIKPPVKGFTFFFLGIIILWLFGTGLYFVDLKILNLTYYQSDKAVLFSEVINRFLDIGETNDTYFLGFMSCYALVCACLSLLIETVYEAVYNVRSKIKK